jgi:hypothetical protein
VRETLLIIDDFLDNAAELREAALRLTYPPQQDALPGRNSLERINIGGLAQQVSWLVNEPLAPSSTNESHARCRLTLEKDNAEARVQAAGHGWCGNLYLSRENCSGSHFLRHRRTNTDGVAASDSEMSATAFKTAAEMREGILEQDGTTESCWEPIMHVPIRFNRLLLYRPWLWNKPGPGFGERPENGRLVYSMFFIPATMA